jgi:hypothetical protein
VKSHISGCDSELENPIRKLLWPKISRNTTKALEEESPLNKHQAYICTDQMKPLGRIPSDHEAGRN